MSVEIIAEAAQGYEGNVTQARLLARAAARAGADAVKFQLVYADELATPDYQYYDLFRNLEMPAEAWQAVASEAHAGGIRLIFDVYGERSLREALAFGAHGIKIHATDFFNARLVRLALEQVHQIYVSLGGISADELEAFLAQYAISPERAICFMVGFQAEPTPIDANHLRRLGAFRERFPGYRFGFMDHADGDSDDALTLALLALPYEVACIEKHLSLDRSLQLEDYVSAVAPDKFALFVQRVRHLEAALGSPDLTLTSTEREYRRKALKVVVTTRALKRGEPIGPDVVALKRSAQATVASLTRLDQVEGRVLAVDVPIHQPLSEELFT